MQSFGNYLKEKREAKNVSLKDIARSTNITERYLDLIEKDEFESVPGGAYIRGYISSYASFIGIDTHETIERFDSFRREKYEAERNQKEMSKLKVQRNPIMFLSNKGKWVIICSTILILMALGALNILSRDDKKALVVADLHGDRDKELKINDDIRSKDPQPLETNGYTLSHEIKENFSNSSSLALPSGHLDEISKGESSIHEMADRSRKAAKDETVEIVKDSRLEDKKADKSSPKNKLNPNDQKMSKPKIQIPAPNSDQRTGTDKSNPEINMKVLKTAVCKDVEHKNPFGEAHSVQWSTDRVYVWNLIECETSVSLIRHIYYFKGKKISDIPLDIKSHRWRTWSYKALSDKRFIGPWRVDITSADGKLLKSVRFEVS